MDIDFSPARAARTSAAIGDTLGNAPEDYVDPGPGATLRDGLAVRGEEVGRAREAVSCWRRRVNLVCHWSGRDRESC